MLFQLDRATPLCNQFESLNSELLYFLEHAIEAENFVRELLTPNIGQVCWDHRATPQSKTKKTWDRFNELWEEVSKLTEAERRALHESLSQNIDVKTFFSDRTAPFPILAPEALVNKLASLTIYLFTDTKDLAGIRDICGNTVAEHFETFRTINGKVCQVCGTELLAAKRDYIGTGQQWRAPYDHLLSKEKHPAYAINPHNLVPICFTCNSKAKGSKELLMEDKLRRRLCFYPYIEGSYQFLSVEIVPENSIPTLKVSWSSESNEIIEKLTSWDSVYSIKARVQGEQSDFISWIDSECKPRDLADFQEAIRRKSEAPRRAEIRSECWKFWRTKLYQWIHQQGEPYIESLWLMMLERRDDLSYSEEFVI